MKLLAGRSEALRGRCVVLFGSGLVGNSIRHGLNGLGDWYETIMPYDWSNFDQRQRVLASAIPSATGECYRCDVIWAAGASGFGSDTQQMGVETAALRQIVEHLALAHAGAPLRSLAFHMTSSAGGLFEGVTRTTAETVPQPKRPYGLGKLEQEQMCRMLPDAVAVQIYRPTSIYGYNLAARRGLFATLISNALVNRPTYINGMSTTLRDYVYAEDIGRFVAERVGATTTRRDVHLLGSGRPTSMFEAIAVVEDLLQRRVYRQYEPRASNAANITFSPGSLPADFSVTPFQTGLASMFARIREAHVRNPGMLR